MLLGEMREHEVRELHEHTLELVRLKDSLGMKDLRLLDDLDDSDLAASQGVEVSLGNTVLEHGGLERRGQRTERRGQGDDVATQGHLVLQGGEMDELLGPRGCTRELEAC